MSEVFLTAAFFTMLLIIIVLAVYLLSDKFRMFVKRSTANFLQASLTGREQYQQALMHFTEAVKSEKYQTLSVYKPMLADQFLNLLQMNYSGLVETVSKQCNLDRTCNAIIKIVMGSGNTFMLSLNWHNTDYHDHKGRTLYQSDFSDISNFLNSDKEFAMCMGVDIIMSHTLDEDHSDVIALLGLINQSEVERIYYTEEGISTRIFNLVMSGGMYMHKSFTRRIQYQDDEYLNLAYNKVKLKYGGEEVELSMAKAVNYAIEGLMLPQPSNLFMCGDTGTGKTELSQQIIARLAERRDVRVLTLTPGVVKELSTSTGQGQFQASMEANAESGVRTVIVIDEAESAMVPDIHGNHSHDNSFLLQLLSGTLQQDLNCSCVLIFNARPETLNDKLFRAGRMGMWMDLTPLQAEQAGKLVSYLRETLIEKVFDNEGYRSLLTNINKLIGGRVYAAAGQITLADVYSCFMDRDRRAMLINQLREEAGKAPLLEKKMPLPTPVEIPVEEKQIRGRVRGTTPTVAPAKTEPAPEAATTTAPTPTIANHRKRNRKRRK